MLTGGAAIEGDSLLTLPKLCATRRKSLSALKRIPDESLSSNSFNRETTGICDVLGITIKWANSSRAGLEKHNNVTSPLRCA